MRCVLDTWRCVLKLATHTERTNVGSASETESHLLTDYDVFAELSLHFQHRVDFVVGL